MLTPLEKRIEELRIRLKGRSLHAVARRTGGVATTGIGGVEALEIRLWDTLYHITWPDIQVTEASSGQSCHGGVEAVLLYYLHTADGIPLTGQWIGFKQLPGGTFYNQAFQGYSGNELVRHFGDDVASFRQAAEYAGCIPIPVSDAGFSFPVMPRVPVAVVYWLGEESIPTQAQILFDQAASHYLPTDVYAGLGAQLVRRIIQSDYRGVVIR